MDTSLETSIPSNTKEDYDEDQEQYDAVERGPRALHTQLIPPDNTNYWGKQTLTILNNAPVTWTNGVSAGTVTWNVDVYKYVSGAGLDDPNFASKGEIVLLFVHSGTVRLGSIYYERQFHVSVGAGPGITAVKQAPPYGVQSGQYYDHTIDYRETLQLRRNNGTELFPWEVIYYETFSRGQYAQQTGHTPGHLEAESAVAYMKNARSLILAVPNVDPDAGISVFKSNNPARFPVQFSTDFVTIPKERIITIPPTPKADRSLSTFSSQPTQASA
ncbi:hypothetical protein ONZ45_g14465 [Pleurotus djamor]|nr:hypothetical protein ONZ45_g14465 [Pleurotus djamor]